MAPFQLTALAHEEIFQKLHTIFKDLPFYAPIIEKPMKKLIEDTNKIDIDIKSTRKLSERYFDVETYKKTEKGLIILSQIHICVRCAYVMILSYNPKYNDLLYGDIPTLLFHYPEFCDQDEYELTLLLR